MLIVYKEIITVRLPSSMNPSDQKRTIQAVHISLDRATEETDRVDRSRSRFRSKKRLAWVVHGPRL